MMTGLVDSMAATTSPTMLRFRVVVDCGSLWSLIMLFLTNKPSDDVNTHILLLRELRRVVTKFRSNCTLSVVVTWIPSIRRFCLIETFAFLTVAVPEIMIALLLAWISFESISRFFTAPVMGLLMFVATTMPLMPVDCIWLWIWTWLIRMSSPLFSQILADVADALVASK